MNNSISLLSSIRLRACANSSRHTYAEQNRRSKHPQKRRQGRLRYWIVCLTFILFVSGCSSRSFIDTTPIPDDRHPVPKPEYRDTFNDFEDFIEKQFSLQGEQMFDMSRNWRKLTNNPKEAYNVDAFDGVPNSSWFTNRHGGEGMDFEALVRGPNSGTGPDTSRAWNIIRAKGEGVTVGFTIVDGRGDTYVIKFDPIGFAGLNSGSEVIGAKLYYAAGFNTPENYVTFFDPKILSLGDKVKYTDEKGRKRYMVKEDLDHLLTRVDYLPNGLIRATASKYVPGKILGPFKYENVRSDDPNEFIPHEHRRELRALRVMAAWLNHIDSKGANSMDTYIGEDGEGYVNHFLIDFGTILGSGGRGPQPKYRGYHNEFDPKDLLFRILTFGLYIPEWEKQAEEVPYPSIGRYDSEWFHPRKFEIIFPNTAFDNLTNADAYWGAKLVMSFTDEELEAVVAEAHYPSQDAAAHLLKNMIARREATGKYWFGQVTPLEVSEFKTDPNLGFQLNFSDLAIEHGFESVDCTLYRVWQYEPGEKMHSERITDKDRMKFTTEELRPLSGNKLILEISASRDRGESWSPSMRLFLQKFQGTDQYQLAGLRH